MFSKPEAKDCWKLHLSIQPCQWNGLIGVEMTLYSTCHEYYGVNYHASSDTHQDLCNQGRIAVSSEAMYHNKKSIIKNIICILAVNFIDLDDDTFTYFSFCQALFSIQQLVQQDAWKNMHIQVVTTFVPDFLDHKSPNFLLSDCNVKLQVECAD